MSETYGPAMNCAKWFFNSRRWDNGTAYFPNRGPDLSFVDLDSPDRDALALAAIARWLGEELLAGRITPKGATT